MLLTILFSLFFIVGVSLLVLYTIFHKLYWKYDKKIDMITESKKYRQCRDILHRSSDWARKVHPEDVPTEAAIEVANEELEAMNADVNKLDKKRKKYDKIADKLGGDGCNTFAWIATILGGIATVICIIALLVSNSPRIIKQNVDKITMERESLIYRLETHDSVGNEYLYNDVVEFNKKVYDYTYYHNSIWMSWFNPEEYTKIEPIDYQKIIEARSNNE